MAIIIERINRYAVKGLHAEPLQRVTLATHQGLAHDRRFAIARGDTKLDADRPRWLPKQKLVMLMRDAEMARLAYQLDVDAGMITLRAPGAEPCTATFATAAGRSQLEGYVNRFLGERREGPARWIEAGAISFTDLPHNCVSLLNLESVRDLESRTGLSLDPRRFRANFLLQGAAPFAEFDWVGHEIGIGSVRLRIATRIPRCAATAVHPGTGERDVNVVQSLRRTYGHHDMGVYAEVVAGGSVAVADVVTPPRDPQRRSYFGHRLRFLSFLARSVPTVLRRR